MRNYLSLGLFSLLLSVFLSSCTTDVTNPQNTNTESPDPPPTALWETHRTAVVAVGVDHNAGLTHIRAELQLIEDEINPIPVVDYVTWVQNEATSFLTTNGYDLTNHSYTYTEDLTDTLTPSEIVTNANMSQSAISVMTDLEDVLSQYYSSDNLVVFKSDCDSILELALNLSDEVEAVTCAVGVSVAKNSAIYWDVVSPANHWGLTDPTPVSIGKSATRIAVSDSELRQQCIDADIAGAVTGAAIGAVVGIATGPGVIASTLAASVAGALTASAEASVQDLIVGAVNSVWSTLFGD